MCRRLTNSIFFGLVLLLISAGVADAFDLNDSDLVGYWSFNEGSGTVAADLSANGYDGTLNGGVTWTGGIYGGALHFDGSGGNVGTGQSILNNAPGFTLAGWVSASNVDVYSSLFGQNDLVEFGFIGNSQVGTWLLGNNWQLVAADYPFDYPSWHHVALTGGAAGAVIYIDGQEAASDPAAVSSGSSGFTFKIGADVFNTTGDPFLGEIDDVWVFSRALTPEEIQVLMQGSGEYPYALSPDPADGATHLETWVTLRWRAGDSAVSHDVYAGDNFDDVNDGTGETFRGNQTTTFYIAGFAGYAFPDGLVPATTYYWRIDEVEADGTTHEGDVWSFFVPPLTAYHEVPGDGSMFVPVDVALEWMAGFNATLHTVYFGDNFDTVANATEGEPVATTTFNPGALELNKTYYWRVDEFSPPFTHTGDVWTFTTTLPGLGTAVMERWDNLSGDNINTIKDDPRFPNNPDVTETVNRFAWDGADLDDYGARIEAWVYAPATGDYTFWLNSDNQGELWLSTDDDSSNVVLIAQESSYSGLNAWNTGEGQSDPIPLIGGEKYYMVAIWKEGGGGDHCQVAWEGPGIPDRVIIPGGNLSPFEPVTAFGAKPGNRAIGVTQTPTLRWKAGLQAESHELYFGTDEAAVANATKASPEYKGSKALGDESFEPGKLPWESTFYWRVDEVAAGNPDSPWVGSVWSFTTADFLIVDDFEGYTDDDAAGGAVWQSWIDGFGVAGNGSQSGYTLPPYAERTIVHDGRQSLPLQFNNTGGVTNSQAELKLGSPPRDWTEGGVAILSIWLQGRPASTGSFTEGPVGTFTMTGSGTDITGTSDEFHYAYRTLTGAGSIIVKVNSVLDTNAWAKAGVMIRSTLDTDSQHAMAFVTPGQGVVFEYRQDPGGSSVGNAGRVDGVTAPHWVKIERDIGGNFTASHSTDGSAWQPLGTPQNIQMGATVFIGLALTSHNASATSEAVFSNVTVTGNVTGQWMNQDIGIASNAAEPLYVAVSNATGAPVIVAHDDPGAAQIDTWTQWTVDLSTFSDQGINLSDVDKIAIGLGAKGGAAAGGSGIVFIDDITLQRPAPDPQP